MVLNAVISLWPCQSCAGAGETRAEAAAPWVTCLSFAPVQEKGKAGSPGLEPTGCCDLMAEFSWTLFHLSSKFVRLCGVGYSKATSFVKKYSPKWE